MSKRLERKIVREIKKEKRIVVRPTPRRENPRPVRRFVPRPAPPARRVFRRRGRGDVWMQTRGGKWVDVNDRGTFKYLEDNKIGLTIDVQFTKRGKGTVISAVSISAKDHKVVALSDGSVELNGESVRGRKGKGAVFDFAEDEVKVFKFKKGYFEIRGLSKERFSFEYEKETKSYQIVVGTVAAHHVGLFADPRHAKKYQIPESESPFERYVKFQVVKPLRPTRKQRKAAKTCCKKLTGIKRKECKSDYYRVGKCLHYYTHKKPSLN